MKLTFRQFVNLGERMRRAQQAYFDRRDQRDLQVSKELEREFDAACAAFHQGDMFEGE